MIHDVRENEVMGAHDLHLQNTEELYGSKLAASDGDIGQVKDCYFDDEIWVIRYLVADTGNWMTGRLVLISPHALGTYDRDNKTLPVDLRKEQIENSPSIDLHKPVSRQYEMEYYRYYGWPTYWDGGAMWGLGGYPMAGPFPGEDVEAQPKFHHREDKHLRSTVAVTGYHIQAADGAIGHVSGFLLDDRSWAIRDLVVETGHWYAGKTIRIPTSKVECISYEESKVFVNLSKADIQRAPEDGRASGGAANGAAAVVSGTGRQP
jgi:hypothetical protein